MGKKILITILDKSTVARFCSTISKIVLTWHNFMG